jgi:hypothetical protein
MRAVQPRSLHFPPRPETAPDAPPRSANRAKRANSATVARSPKKASKLDVLQNAVQHTGHPDVLSPNPLNAMGEALRESKLISTTMRESLTSHNRHGDFFVARNAALRLIEKLTVLIEAEERV